MVDVSIQRLEVTQQGVVGLFMAAFRPVYVLDRGSPELKHLSDKDFEVLEAENKANMEFNRLLVESMKLGEYRLDNVVKG